MKFGLSCKDRTLPKCNYGMYVPKERVSMDCCPSLLYKQVGFKLFTRIPCCSIIVLGLSRKISSTIMHYHILAGFIMYWSNPNTEKFVKIGWNYKVCAFSNWTTKLLQIGKSKYLFKLSTSKIVNYSVYILIIKKKQKKLSCKVRVELLTLKSYSMYIVFLSSIERIASDIQPSMKCGELSG